MKFLMCGIIIPIDGTQLKAAGIGDDCRKLPTDGQIICGGILPDGGYCHDGIC